MPISLVLWLFIAAIDPVDSLPALRAALSRAQPGDRITLASGTYEGSISLHGLRGTLERPIVLSGADAEPPVIRGSGSCIHLRAPAYVVVENLVLEGASGNGINIDDAGDLAHPAPGVVLRKLRVRDIGPKGNCDGIKLSGLVDFVVEDCRVERWGSDGSGVDMVGCADGVVRNCTFTHGEGQGANGVQLKGGTRDVAVRSCLFQNAGQRAVNVGGSTGLQFFRPAPKGFEAARIVVEGCTIVGSDAAVAFVGIDGADFRFNTIYHPRRWALRILQETRSEGFAPCRGGRFTDNLVVLAGRDVRAANIGDMTDAASFEFARNFWCWEGAPATRPTLPSPETEGTYGVDPKLRDPAGGVFEVQPESAARRVGAHAYIDKPR